MLPGRIDIFGSSILFAPCSADPDENCLNLITGGQSAVEHQSRYSNTDMFFITLDVSEEFLFNNPDDDHLQSISIEAPASTVSFTALGSMDYRIPDFGNSIFGGDRYIPDTGISLEDSDVCTEFSGCHEAFFLLMSHRVDFDSWTGIIYFVLDFSPSQRHTVSYVDNDYQPLSPQPASVQQPLPRGWLDFQAQTQPSVEGFSFNGWGSYSSPERYLTGPMFPVLQDDTIFPWMAYELNVWSEGVRIDTRTIDFPVLPNQLTIPTGVNGDVFLGWSLTDGGALIENPDSFMIQGPGPVNVYAVFQVPSFDIRLSVEGELTTVTANSTTNLSELTSPVHSQNHAFLGWSLTEGGLLITDSSFTLAAPGPHTLFAVFEQPQAEPEQTPESEPEQTPESEPEQTPESEPEQTPRSPESSAPSQPLPVPSGSLASDPTETREEQSTIFSGPSGGELSLSIRKVNATQVKFYAEFPQVGQKIQFLVQREDGSWRERGWLRVELSDLTDSGEYRGLQNSRFFIRTVTLREGTNRLRIVVDGAVLGGTQVFQQSN
jgi:hypothetical protein